MKKECWLNLARDRTIALIGREGQSGVFREEVPVNAV